MTGWDGLLLIDKPVGPTSHDIVARVRRICRTRRVGHAGTLDPPASGLLPVVMGRATRFVRFLHHSPKRYVGEIELGRTTSTDDVTGETLESYSGSLPPVAAVLEASRAFLGAFDQAPPRVSARKVGGQRLYALARRGIEAEVPPRAVEVSRFDLEPAETGDSPTRRYRFVAEVTGGTYIRSLARDLGAALGCGGTLATLRRTSIGPQGTASVGTALHVDRAVPLADEGPDPDLEPLRQALIPLSRMPLEPPDVILPSTELARRLIQGQVLDADGGWPEGLVCARSATGELLGMAEVGAGRMRPRVVVPPV